ncbi:MAG: conjugal transfer protein TraF [Gammaproteobacteria bacterium]
MRHLIAVVVFWLISLAISADDRSGYWWYSDPVVREEIVEEEIPRRYATMQEMWLMHPDELEPIIKARLRDATGNATVENVTRWKEALSVSVRKSAMFAAVDSVVNLQRPDLHTADDFPTNVPGREAFVEARANVMDQALLNGQQDFALVMLSERSCAFCVPQRAILKHFQAEYQWPWREVDIKENPGAALKFAVSQTPTTILVYKGTGDWMPVSVGVVDLPTLKRNLYGMMRIMSGGNPGQFFSYDGEPGLDPMLGMPNAY